MTRYKVSHSIPSPITRFKNRLNSLNKRHEKVKSLHENFLNLHGKRNAELMDKLFSRLLESETKTKRYTKRPPKTKKSKGYASPKVSVSKLDTNIYEKDNMASYVQPMISSHSNKFVNNNEFPINCNSSLQKEPIFPPSFADQIYCSDQNNHSLNSYSSFLAYADSSVQNSDLHFNGCVENQSHINLDLHGSYASETLEQRESAGSWYDLKTMSNSSYTLNGCYIPGYYSGQSSSMSSSDVNQALKIQMLQSSKSSYHDPPSNPYPSSSVTPSASMDNGVSCGNASEAPHPVPPLHSGNGGLEDAAYFDSFRSVAHAAGSHHSNSTFISNDHTNLSDSSAFPQSLQLQVSSVEGAASECYAQVDHVTSIGEVDSVQFFPPGEHELPEPVSSFYMPDVTLQTFDR